jgi:hypothetical protein
MLLASHTKANIRVYKVVLCVLYKGYKYERNIHLFKVMFS